MNNITEITKREIFSLFQEGYEESDFLVVFYPYYGQLSELEFLRKLYPSLDKMRSNDPHCQNAESEIWQHTINNNDWKIGWVFTDDRFELLNGNDIHLLSFLCAVFHPVNRNEKGSWKEYIERINDLLNADGYELFESEKISGRAVYSWRKLTEEESASGRFLPFSLRHKKDIDSKAINLPTISKKIRAELIRLFSKYDETQYRNTETNLDYTISSKEAVIEDLRDWYTPKAFDTSGKYSETDDLDQFIMNNYPCCVFDAIEIFTRLDNHGNFVDEVNLILQKSRFMYRLLGGKIDIAQNKIQTAEVIKEVGLKELVEQATTLFNGKSASDKQLAVEKLWDAFERMKTYYGDKKASVERIVNDIANGDKNYIDLLDKEFKELTNIGNKYRIRHHETDKIDISDNNYYDYLFQRCFALIDFTLKYLK